jgi:hypothetical protein
MKNTILFILFAILFASCENFFEQVVDVDLPEHEPALAITGILTKGDSSLQVYVYQSVGALSEDESEGVTNAIVSLWKGNSIAYTFEDASQTPPFSSGVYKLNVPGGLELDGEYSLQVESAGFKTVRATQVAPAPALLKTASFQENGTIDESGNRANEIKMTMSDPAGEVNYYALRAWRKGPGSRSRIFLSSQDPLVTAGNDELLFSGESFDGQERTLSFYYFGDYPIQEQEWLEIELRTISRERFEYSRALFNYEDSEFNPFAEPVTIPSSFDDGFGIFSLEGKAIYRIDP